MGVVCKSLLGKAHTVMAEGGVAAALANVDDRDNWRVHFSDTMRGGQYLNNWRMAELHAKEAPERVRELEAWGALFDRTKDGRILQRNFGGHRYPRLAHVGDRTGLEMIRTLQDHGIHTGMEVHMECTVLSLLLDSGRIAGAFGYDREKGPFHSLAGEGRRAGHRRHRARVQDHQQQLGIHRRRPRAGLSRGSRTASTWNSFSSIPRAWCGRISVRGILVTEGVRGEGGVLRNSEGRRFMFDDIPDLYKAQTADNEEEGWRYTQGDKNARRPPELLTRDHVARCINREVKAGRGSPHGGVFLDIAWIKKHIPNSEEHIKRKLPSMYHQFKQLADIDITKEPMEVGPTTHYMMGGVSVDGDSQMSTVPGLFAAGEVAAACMARIGWAETRYPICWYSASARASTRQSSRNRTAPRGLTRTRSRPMRSRRSSRSIAGRRAKILIRSSTSCRNRCSPWSASCGPQRDGAGAGRDRGSLARARRVAGIAGNRQYNNGWHTAMDLRNLLMVSEAVTRAALLREESRGAQFRDDFPARIRLGQI